MTPITLSSLSAITFNINSFVPCFLTAFSKERKIAQLLKSDKHGKPFDFFIAQEAWDMISSRYIAYKAEYQNAIHSSRQLIGGDGLTIQTDWKILESGHEPWNITNKKNIKGGVIFRKGFSYVKLQHNTHPNARLTIYNVHCSRKQHKKGKREKIMAQNLQQLVDHINTHATDDAIIVGGDFNWRHRWRAHGARPDEGRIDPEYNMGFTKDDERHDPLDVLAKGAGLTDVEFILKKTYDHYAPIDKFFVKNGSSVSITVKDSPYLYKHTPWSGISDHHPLALYFDLNFTS
jgi:endonuclease/exonuclease/phosphatase family metal-dependent hydrolase